MLRMILSLLCNKLCIIVPHVVVKVPIKTIKLSIIVYYLSKLTCPENQQFFNPFYTNTNNTIRNNSIVINN